MQYQVPHFLEIEQRILGPFTFANFVILIGVGGVLALLYFMNIGFVIWVTISALAIAITLGLMFGSYNGRPFSLVIIDIVRHFLGDRKHTWTGVETKESVSEFVLTKKELRNLPNEAHAQQKDEKPLGQRIEEISKLLDSK